MKRFEHVSILLCVSLLGSAATATICFSPALAADGDQSLDLRLVFFSDVHARTEWDTPLALAMAAEAINAEKADLVIAGGDLITDGFESSAAAVAPRWDAYMAMHDAIAGHVHAVIGNHDLVAAIPEDGTEPSNDPRAAFRKRFDVDRTYYSFDINGYHIILLDSIQIAGNISKYQGWVSQDQLKWLEDDLSRVPTNRPIVVALHIPLVTSFFQLTEGPTSAAPAGRVVVNAQDVLDVFADHNLILVLQGHLHVHEAITWQDTVFITGGALSGKWWRGAWHGTDAGYTVVRLRDSEIEWDYKTYGWQERRPSDQ